MSDSYPRHVIGPGPNIVTGFLAHWVCCAPTFQQYILIIYVRLTGVLPLLMRTTGFVFQNKKTNLVYLVHSVEDLADFDQLCGNKSDSVALVALG